jgi:hypothetical protein
MDSYGKMCDSCIRKKLNTFAAYFANNLSYDFTRGISVENLSVSIRPRKIEKREYSLRHICLSIRNPVCRAVCLPVCHTVRPSVRPSTWNNSNPTGRIFVKFGTCVLLQVLSRKFNFHYNLTRMTATLHKDICKVHLRLYEDLCQFMISPWILLGLGNVSEKVVEQIETLILCSIQGGHRKRWKGFQTAIT